MTTILSKILQIVLRLEIGLCSLASSPVFLRSDVTCASLKLAGETPSRKAMFVSLAVITAKAPLQLLISDFRMKSRGADVFDIFESDL